METRKKSVRASAPLKLSPPHPTPNLREDVEDTLLLLRQAREVLREAFTGSSAQEEVLEEHIQVMNWLIGPKESATSAMAEMTHMMIALHNALQPATTASTETIAHMEEEDMAILQRYFERAGKA